MELKQLYVEPSIKSPQIDFNNFTGELILSGKSIPENSVLIYEKVLLWVNEYIKNPKPTTNLRISLEYFNTSSAIWIAKIVAALASIEGTEATLFIHLYFNIEDFDEMETDDIKDELHPIINMIGFPTISVGIKIYGTNDEGEVLKESIVLI